MMQICGGEFRTGGESCFSAEKWSCAGNRSLFAGPRLGKTAYALKLGKELGASSTVLYLNMELYGGLGGHFPEEGSTLADALYYSRMEGKELGWMLATMVSPHGPSGLSFAGPGCQRT